MQFKDLNIMPEILRALKNENYKIPTPIQEEAIPCLLYTSRAARVLDPAYALFDVCLHKNQPPCLNVDSLLPEGGYQ